jgi:hypothetical protein
MQDRSRYDNDVPRARRRRGLWVALVSAAIISLIGAGLSASSAASAPTPTCRSKPDATNTGASGQLNVSNVRSLAKRNSKLTDVRLKSTLVVSADGSIVRNVTVNGRIIVTGDDVTLDHVTAKSVIVSGASHLTVSNANLSGGGTAVYVVSDRGAAHGVSRVKLVRNYIHDPASKRLSSYSGTLLRGAKDVTISCSNYALGEYGRAAIHMENVNGGTSNVVVSNNWLSGGQFTVSVDANQVTLKKNVFDKSAHSSACRTAGQPISQSRNRLTDGSRIRPCPTRGQQPSGPTPQPTPTAMDGTSTPATPTPSPSLALTSSPTVTATRSPTPTAKSSSTPTGDSTEAAVVNRWGPVVAGDEFNYTGAPDNLKWNVYDSAGHAGNGVRSPAAWNVDGSAARVTGDSTGTTGGMSAKFDRRKYGRWEARMRTSARDSEYHPVLLLWPQSKDWPCDGEIDYAEGVGDTTRMNFFLHHGCNNEQISSRQVIDTTQWHNYAVDWDPDGITGYIDGVQWFRTTNVGYLPPGGMYQTIQLDWFPDGTTLSRSWMEVDWVRVYAPDLTSTASSTPATAPTSTLTPDPSPTSSPTPATAPSPTVTSDPSPTQATGDIVIGAVGDTNPSGNTSTTLTSGLNAASIKTANLDAWLHLGDHQYNYGDCNSLVNQFDKAGWGAVWGKALNVSGPTHDWSSGTDLSSVTQHQAGTCSGQTSGRSLDNILTGRNLGPDSNYVVDLGAWRVVSMSSGLWRYDTSKANAATGWLDTALATAKAAGDHVIVVWHEPYWTSTSEEHGPTPAVKPWIDLLDKYDVPLLLNGHQHGYARFYPQLANSTKDDAAGTQEFIVGTGGIGSYSWTSTATNVATQQADTYGWLKLTLHADGHYDWQFIRTSGGTYTDRGSRSSNR